MKKTFVAAMVAGISAMAAVHSASAATVNGGNVSFKGEVVNAACAVDSNSSNQTVNMGQVRLAELGKAAGTQASSRTPFSIQLNDCDPTVSAATQVVFNGIPAESNPSVLHAGQGSSSATGVGIQIFDNSGKPVALGKPSGKVTLIDGVNVLQFQSGFISTSDAPTAGDASATANFTLTYS
ncbi:fimbrial protein [Enterobacillus tribolii]|uniref:Type 1 fimbria pilin n=1 Tax=Enterobacillus tribolii TaxID=1487935 RepID=A0A370R1N0_9GAMM|nr:fimbrial protein [Enterobacillus tribolii]MBW7983077.1 fimbrial protein [Enterobacillus tribolii]RDK95819.1 type 1 fimbria pilin [Enterobacillus tribolii]